MALRYTGCHRAVVGEQGHHQIVGLGRKGGHEGASGTAGDRGRYPALASRAILCMVSVLPCWRPSYPATALPGSGHVLAGIGPPIRHRPTLKTRYRTLTAR
jgi:hypothetical protein